MFCLGWGGWFSILASETGGGRVSHRDEKQMSFFSSLTLYAVTQTVSVIHLNLALLPYSDGGGGS